MDEIKYLIGDSRKVLSRFDSKSVQSIYLDPPFNSSRKYRLTSCDKSIGFDDLFKTDEAYIKLIEPVLKESVRLLKDSGTLFFHISAEQMLIPHMLCAKYFPNVSPIFWKRSRSKNNTKKKLGACTDVIFRCTFSNSKFNMVYQELDEKYARDSYKNEDERGQYALGHICYTRTQAPDPIKRKDRYYTLINDGIEYTPKYGWRLSREDLNSLIDDGRVHFPSKSGSNPYKKIYKHESLGKPATDLWDDIHSLAMGTEERVYPTQKPTALLERLIKMSTDEGDLVLDPFAGSGTTGIVSRNLKRKCLLVDKNKQALRTFEQRLKS